MRLDIGYGAPGASSWGVQEYALSAFRVWNRMKDPYIGWMFTSHVVVYLLRPQKTLREVAPCSKSAEMVQKPSRDFDRKTIFVLFPHLVCGRNTFGGLNTFALRFISTVVGWSGRYILIYEYARDSKFRQRCPLGPPECVLTVFRVWNRMMDPSIGWLFTGHVGLCLLRPQKTLVRF